MRAPKIVKSNKATNHGVQEGPGVYRDSDLGGNHSANAKTGIRSAKTTAIKSMGRVKKKI